MKTHLLGSFIAALLLAGAAQAQQVVSYVTSSLNPLLTGTPNSDTRSIQLPGFDANLGTLTHVTLTFDGFVQQRARGEFYNNAGTGTSPFSYNLTTTVSLDRTGGPDLLDFTPVTLAGAGTRQSLFDGTIDFAGASGFDTTLITTALLDSYFAPQNLLASYISVSPVSFLVTATGNSSISGPGNVILGTTNLVGGFLGVEYTYTAIPEPSTYAAILGAATLGYAALRRRKQKQVVA